MSRHLLAKDDQWTDSIGQVPSACVQGEGCVGDPVKLQTRMGCCLGTSSQDSPASYWAGGYCVMDLGCGVVLPAGYKDPD